MDLLHFAPVPSRKRHAGWTPERQRAFILAIARGRSPAAAVARIGLSRSSVYRLRDRPDGAEFAAAWERAAAAA